MKVEDQLFENLHDMGGPQRQVARFDPFSIETLQNMPRMRSALDDARLQVDEGLHAIKNHFGVFPLKLLKWLNPRFKDVAFDWYVDPSKMDKRATDALIQIEDAMWELAPWFKPVPNNRQEQQPYYYDTTHGMDHDELKAVIGNSELDLDIDHYNEQLADALRYRFYTSLIELSDVVEYLNGSGAAFQYMRHHDKNKLIVSEPRVATYLKLTYG